MYLKKLILKNWCQFSERTFEFHRGVNALVGPNGSGKSNTLKAIVWVLTGTDRNIGVKLDNINQLAARNDKAHVTLDASHAGVDFTVSRGLRPDKRELTIHQTGKTYRKEAEIASELRNILGTSEKMLLDYVFVGQGKIFDFLSQTEAVRADSFGRLFGLDKLEQIHKLLGEVVIEVPSPTVDVDATSLRLMEAETRVAEAEQALLRYATLPDNWIESRDPRMQLVENRPKFLQAAADMAVAEDRLVRTVRPALAATGEAAIAGREELRGVEELVVSRRPAAEQARNELAAWSAYDRTQKLRQQLDAEAVRLSTAATVWPTQPAGYFEDKSETHVQLIDLRKQRLLLGNRLASLEKLAAHRVAECPTCGTPVSALRENLEELTANHNRVELRVLELERLEQSSANYRAAFAVCERGAQQLVADRRRLEDQRASLAELPVPVRSRDELNAILTEHREIEDGLIALKNEFGVSLQVEANLRRSAADLEIRISQLQEYCTAVEVSEEAAQQAALELASIREAVNVRNRLRAEHGVHTRERDALKASLVKAQQERQRSANVVAARTQVVRIREAFHRDNLAKQVIENYLAAAKDDVDDMLTAFDNPFRLAEIDGTRMVVSFPDGRRQPAERLSDGQKAVFALGFRVTINSRFGGDLGLLCLDEPSAGLDADNMTCLEIALGRLRELSRDRGLQVLLVTHERGQSLYDKVFDLAARAP